MLQPVIIGAGPAGIRAAETLVAHGLRPVVVDEAAKGGGQIYRQQPDGFSRPPEALYGLESGKARSVHAALAAIRDRIEYRPDTLAWGLEGGTLDLSSGGRTERLAYSHLILATGATDRVLPFPGWLIPGVYTMGGAQVALKFQGCAIGRRTVFLGTGPLLYLVAYQYAKAGATVAAVLDTAPRTAQLAALPGMALDPVTTAKGLWYMARLAAWGVPLHAGVRPERVIGDGQVEALDWAKGTRSRRTECDAIGFGLGLRSETQLADLAGCRFAWSPLNRAWLPERDRAGRSSVPGIYLAGDGAGIAGADAAELAGTRAALALLEDAGHPVDPLETTLLDRRLRAIGRFRRALERAFPFPASWDVADETVLCRCEEVTAGTLRATGAREINRLKALSRVGMGRCQGRICAAAATELMAGALGTGPEAVGRLRGQPPVKPIPMDLVPLAEAAQ